MSEARTINDVAYCLQARTSDRPLVDIELLSLLVQPEQHEITSDVEYRVDTGSQE